jgi:hypothetical protein
MPVWLDGVEVSPQITLLSGDRIRISDNLATDLACNGTEIVAQSAGEPLSTLEVAYFKSDGAWWLSDASGAATSSGMLGLATDAAGTGGVLSILVEGYARNDAWSFPVGVPLFVSDATPGGITDVAPSGTGDIVRIAGYSVASNSVWFKPSGTFIQIS